MGRDGWTGLGLLILSGWLYSDLGKIPSNPLVPIGPAFYPRFLFLLILALSLVLVVRDLISRPRSEGKERSSLKTWLKSYQATLISFLVFTLYVLLLPKLGYLLSTFLFVSALHWLLGMPRWRRLAGSLVLGIATSLITYLIFESYLRVFLPIGTWLS